MIYSALDSLDRYHEDEQDHGDHRLRDAGISDIFGLPAELATDLSPARSLDSGRPANTLTTEPNEGNSRAIAISWSCARRGARVDRGVAGIGTTNDQIQFTKSPEVLRAMALELTKTAAALEELQARGIPSTSSAR